MNALTFALFFLALLTSQPVISNIQADSHVDNTPPDINALVGYDLQEALSKSNALRDNLLNMKQPLSLVISPETLAKGLDFPEETENPHAGATGVIVLISLTMPNIALEQLLAQSAQYQIPLIIRGVLPSGFKATVGRIHQLLTKGGKRASINSGIAINPAWFTMFNITQVPAFISIKAGRCLPKEICSQQDFDVVYGNISIQDALVILTEGDAKESAQEVIAREANQ